MAFVIRRFSALLIVLEDNDSATNQNSFLAVFARWRCISQCCGSLWNKNFTSVFVQRLKTTTKKINVFSVLQRFRNETYFLFACRVVVSNILSNRLIIWSRKNQWLAARVFVSVLSQNSFINAPGFRCFLDAAAAVLLTSTQHTSMSRKSIAFFLSLDRRSRSMRAKRVREFSNGILSLTV